VTKLLDTFEVVLFSVNRCIYKNNHAKFHPDLIWNDKRLRGFFEEHHPNKNNEMSSDMGSVADLEIICTVHMTTSEYSPEIDTADHR